MIWSVSGLKRGGEAGGGTLEARVAGGLETVWLDPARIRGVRGNLLANALRHTPRGGRISVAAEPDRNGVVITVQDTGSGIPAEMLPRVFERFVKDPASPGSGLGLAIAREVVTAHGGRIGAESTPGGGTVIRAWLTRCSLDSGAAGTAGTATCRPGGWASATGPRRPGDCT